MVTDSLVDRVVDAAAGIAVLNAAGKLIDNTAASTLGSKKPSKSSKKQQQDWF